MEAILEDRAGRENCFSKFQKPFSGRIMKSIDKKKKVKIT
jgi:hypothetical protein